MAWTLWSLVVTLCVCQVGSQSTSSEMGCTFADDRNVYNVKLLPEDQVLACPTKEVLSEMYVDTEDKTVGTLNTAEAMKDLLAKLEEKSRQLNDMIKSYKQAIKETKDTLKQKNILSSDCPPNYGLRSEEFGSCYMFVGRYLTWYDAEKYCISTGGHLVALETPDEQDFLVNYVQANTVLPGKHLWTGGNDIAKEDQWMWAGINVRFNYTQWLLYPHQEHGEIQMPDNYMAVEHCVHLFHLHNYDWNDLYCGNLHYFVCEYKII